MKSINQLFDIQELILEKGLLHCENDYALYFLTEGSLCIQMEFEEIKLEAPAISVIFPRQYHQVENIKDCQGKILRFTEDVFCSEMLRKELKAYCVDLQKRWEKVILTEKEKYNIEIIFEMIEQIYVLESNVLRTEQIRHLIKVILLRLMDVSKSAVLSEQEMNDSNEFVSFNELLETEFKEIRQVNVYADQLGISTKKLNQLCKKFTGQTALQVIHERILLEAKRLLRFSGMSHKEIAYELKFDSPSAFNKFIHAKIGLSPSELQQGLK